MKKAKFKYKTGKSVKFKFYDGSVHDGVIVSKQYRNEDSDFLETQYSMPMYTCHVPDSSGRYSRGYMVYTVTENMIKNKLVGDIEIVAIKDNTKTNKINATIADELQSRKQMDSLDQAIAKQKAFVGGKVNN